MKIVSIAVSKKKGTTKTPVEEAYLVKEHGLEGDAHSGPWHRQVSLLASESIDQANAQGLNVSFGDFAENIATVGVDWRFDHRRDVGDTAVGGAPATLSRLD